MMTEQNPTCKDEKCAVHGSLKVRGNIFEGVVVSAKAPKSITVERTLVVFVPKFERYKKTRSRLHAYSPLCFHIKEGDIVRIGETRRVSKTKAFVVTEKVGETLLLKRQDMGLVEREKREKKKEEKKKTEQELGE